MKRSFWGILFCALLFSACKPPVKSTTENKLPFYFDEIIVENNNSKPSVLKSFGDSTVVKTNEIDWKIEFSFFVEFENLYRKNAGDYSKEEFVVNNDITDLYEYDVVEFTTKNEKLPIQKATYHLVKNVVTKIIFNRKPNQSLFQSEQQLIFQPNIGYSIAGMQSISGYNALSFELKATFIEEILWRGSLTIEEEKIPFSFSLNKHEMKVYNAEETIVVDNVNYKDDSIFIKLPVFNSEIKGKIEEKKITGLWYNYAKGDYSIPFYAEKNQNRFETNSEKKPLIIEGKWEVIFSPNTEDQYPAIGIFKQDGNYVTGTFITETGDYRYLEGAVNENEIKLSCFDGAHAFLFKANLNENRELNGMFYSGSHWQEPWTAKRNEQATIQDPYKLTQLTTTDSILNFSFLNLDSALVSLDNEKYKNKPVIIQIMGSWCPNCMDECNLLKAYYNDYNKKGLEIIALCFERSDKFNVNKKVVQKLKKDLNVPYEMLLAGKASKKDAAATLPMLNHIMSYPTTIYLDKNHKVQRIHTGFYGPSTGPYYDNFVMESRAFVEGLLN